MTLYSSTRRASEIAQHIKRQFGDEAGVQITDSDLLRWINDALMELSIKLKPLKGKATAATVAGQRSYTIPSDGNTLHIESIHIKGSKVDGISFSQAEERMVGQDETSGFPIFWYEWAGEITFWPTPVGPDSLEIYFTRIPEPLSDLSQLLPVPDKHYESLAAFVLARAYELDEQFDAANVQRNLFLSRIGEQADEELVGQNLTYPTITFVED